MIPDCQHLQTETRLYHQINGSTHLAEQCLTCGTRIGNWKKRSGLSDSYKPWDNNLAESYRRWREDERMAEIDQRRARYHAYLETQEWKSLRNRVLARAQGQCEGCGRWPATEVHHLSYEHVGDEFLWELKAVCRDCHDRLHPDKILGPSKGDDHDTI